MQATFTPVGGQPEHASDLGHFSAAAIIGFCRDTGFGGEQREPGDQLAMLIESFGRLLDTIASSGAMTGEQILDVLDLSGTLEIKDP
jgi:hypothetical protein